MFCIQKVLKVANLTLFFSRKYRWPEHYFSAWRSGNSQKLLTTNQFLLSTMFFTIMNISFFNLRFDLFNHHQRSQSNQKQCSLCCGSPCFRVLLCNHYGPLQCFSTHIRRLKEIGALRPIFPDYVFSCDYDLNCVIKTCFQRGFEFIKKNIIYK